MTTHVIEVAPSLIEVIEVGTVIDLVGSLGDTDSLPEGATHLYFTATRAVDAIGGVVDDASSASDRLWSAAKISTALADKAAVLHTHSAADLTGGADGQVLAWLSGAPAWTASPTLTTLYATSAVGIQNASPSVPFQIGTLDATSTALSMITAGRLRTNGLYLGTGTGLSLVVDSGTNPPDYCGFYANYDFRLVVAKTGRVGVNTRTPASQFHVVQSSSDTATPLEVTRLEAKTTGTAAVGFGARLLFMLENGAGTDKEAGAFDMVWANSAAGTEYGLARLMAGAAGSLAPIMQAGYDASGAIVQAFYGLSTPVPQPTVSGSRGGNAALASLLSALAAQGLISDSSTA